MCPKHDLFEMTLNGVLPPCSPRPWPRAPTSIGSPRGVPVPCTDTRLTSSGPIADTLNADLRSPAWLGPFGAVSPLDFPSCKHRKLASHPSEPNSFQQVHILIKCHHLNTFHSICCCWFQHRVGRSQSRVKRTLPVLDLTRLGQIGIV